MLDILSINFPLIGEAILIALIVLAFFMWYLTREILRMENILLYLDIIFTIVWTIASITCSKLSRSNCFPMNSKKMLSEKHLSNSTRHATLSPKQLSRGNSSIRCFSREQSIKISGRSSVFPHNLL